MDVRPNSPNTVISRLSLRLSQPPVSVSLPTSQDIKAKSLLLFIYLGLQPWIQKNGRPQMCHGFINLWRYVVCEVIIQGFVLFCPIQKKKKKSAISNYMRNKLRRNSPVKFEKYSPDDPLFVEQSAAGAHGKSGATSFWFDPRLQSQQLVRSIHLTAPFRMDWPYTEYGYFPGCCCRANKTSPGRGSAEDPLFSWIPLPASQVR